MESSGRRDRLFAVCPGSLSRSRGKQVRVYLSGSRALVRYTNWMPCRSVGEIMSDIYTWIHHYEHNAERWAATAVKLSVLQASTGDDGGAERTGVTPGESVGPGRE